MPRIFFTPQEYARRRGLNIAELQRLIRDGRIGTVQVGDERLIPGEEIAMASAQPPEDNRRIPLSEAIAPHPEVDEAILCKLVRDGVIPSKTPPDSAEPLVDSHELDEAAGRLDPRQWKHLRGRKILISEAARKYGFGHVVLSKWARQGHIRILGAEGYRVYLDEAEVSFAAALAQIAGLRCGRPLFPRVQP